MATLRRPPATADERTQLGGWLDLQRATVRRKCAGLAETDEHRAVLPSSPLMTMAGVVSHLRWVEFGWFQGNMLNASRDDTPWASNDHPDAEMFVAGIPLARLLDEYDEECARSRVVLGIHSLDDLEAVRLGEGHKPVSLRWIVFHMIEETARHLGHLDAIRELLDGETGH